MTRGTGGKGEVDGGLVAVVVVWRRREWYGLAVCLFLLFKKWTGLVGDWAWCGRLGLME